MQRAGLPLRKGTTHMTPKEDDMTQEPERPVEENISCEPTLENWRAEALSLRTKLILFSNKNISLEAELRTEREARNKTEADLDYLTRDGAMFKNVPLETINKIRTLEAELAKERERVCDHLDKPYRKLLEDNQALIEKVRQLDGVIEHGTEEFVQMTQQRDKGTLELSTLREERDRYKEGLEAIRNEYLALEKMVLENASVQADKYVLPIKKWAYIIASQALTPPEKGREP